MATPSGTISLSDVNTELGLSPTAVITMNDAAVRTLAGVPSGAISMQNLQNKSNRVTASATIGSNTSNYTLNTAKAPGYSSGRTDMTLTINSGVFVSSASTGSYSFTVDTSWATGDTLTVINNGTIIGRGGNGGQGGNAISGQQAGSSGATGGPALLVQRAITLDNLNRISGGGGGGGGGGSYYQSDKSGTRGYTGGGGGGGIGVSSGGSGGSTNAPSQFIGGTGGSGTLTSNGGGGSATLDGNSGGAGGSYGASGTAGNRGNVIFSNPGAGGGAGACIVGNSNITYTNTGTRNGSIS